jgi:hypothetical protein
MTVDDCHRLAGIPFYSDNKKHQLIYDTAKQIVDEVVGQLDLGASEVTFIKANDANTYSLSSPQLSSCGELGFDNIKRFSKLLRQLCLSRQVSLYVDNTDFTNYSTLFRRSR